MFAYFRGHKRIEPVFAWTLVLVMSVLIGGALLRLEIEAFFETAARILCGVIWILWLGTQLDWVSLRQLLLAVRIPKDIVASLDHALMHGILTKKEWAKRRDATRLRLGRSKISLRSWGQILGEGALQAFTRLELVEKNATLRSSRVRETSAKQSSVLKSVNVKNEYKR